MFATPWDVNCGGAHLSVTNQKLRNTRQLSLRRSLPDGERFLMSSGPREKILLLPPSHRACWMARVLPMSCEFISSRLYPKIRSPYNSGILSPNSRCGLVYFHIVTNYTAPKNWNLIYSKGMCQVTHAAKRPCCHLIVPCHIKYSVALVAPSIQALWCREASH